MGLSAGAIAAISAAVSAASATTSAVMQKKQAKKKSELMKENESKRAALVSRQSWVSARHGAQSTGQSLLGGQPALGG